MLYICAWCVHLLHLTEIMLCFQGFSNSIVHSILRTYCRSAFAFAHTYVHFLWFLLVVFFFAQFSKVPYFLWLFFLLVGITRCFPINWLGFGYVYFIPHIILSSTRHWLVVRVTNRRYWRGWPGAYIYIYMHICTSVAIRYTHSHTPFRQWPQSDTRKPCAINQAHKNRAVAIVRSEK